MCNTPAAMPRRSCNCRAAARALVAAGYSIYAAAKILGVSPRAVRKWVEEAPEKRRAAEGEAAEAKRLEPLGEGEAPQPMPEWLRQNLWVRRLRGRT